MANEIDEKTTYYLNTLDNKISVFKDFLDSNDFLSLKSFGHKLKGSGKSFGFDEISEIGKKIEFCASINDLSSLIELFEELKVLFHSIKERYRIIT